MAGFHLQSIRAQFPKSIDIEADSMQRVHQENRSLEGSRDTAIIADQSFSYADSEASLAN